MSDLPASPPHADDLTGAQKTIAEPSASPTLSAHMLPAAAPRSPWALALAIIMGFMVALVIGGADLYFKTRILEHGDAAVNALQIDNARHGTEIYGNYSRFQFNHPGPAFFYTYAAGEVVLSDWLNLVPSPHNAHLLASLLIQVSCFALAVAIVHCWIGSWTFVALALLGGVWHFAMAGNAFTSIWPPHVLLMPFLCFIASASSFAAGRSRDFGFMVVTGGLLFHGHVAQPLFVGGVGALAFFLHYRHLKSAGSWVSSREWLRTNRRMLGFCGAWASLIFLPLLIDLVSFGLRGNIATIFHRFYSNAEQSKSAYQSLLYFLSFPTYRGNQEDFFTTLGPDSYRIFQEHKGVLLAWAVFLALPAILAFWRREKLPATARSFLGAAYAILGLTVLLCVMWGKMQAGPMHQFNGYFYHGVYYFAGLLSVGVVCSVPGRLLPVPVTAALCGIAGISASWMFRAPRLSAVESGVALRQGVEAALQQATLSDAKPRPKLLVFEHYAWPEAASVGLELQRRGIPFYVSPTWNFMFGRRHSHRVLGATPEAVADVWWITKSGPAGTTIANDLQIFTRPGEVDPQNTEISFAGRANGFRYLVHGLSVGNVEYAWTDDQRVALQFQPLPASGDVQVVYDATINRRPVSPEAQAAEVIFNGHPLGRLVVTKREQLAITIPRALWNAAPAAVLELRFPDATYFRLNALPANDLWAAWGVYTLRFQILPGN